MGTNYYAHFGVSEDCGRGDEPKHIGKSSAGWCFSLSVIPDDGIRDLPDWQKAWTGAVIKDEYGEVVSEVDLLRVITERDKSWAQFHEMNGSQDGPSGLLRHRIDVFHCIGHGAGTWDLIMGEFS